MNAYSFLLVLAGTLVLLLPFYKLSLWFLAVQGIAALCLFVPGVKLFAAWEDKKTKIKVLVGRNRKGFRPDTFEAYMQAPCGRLVVRSVLRELGRQHEYKNLLKMKKPFLTAMMENCKPVKTVIYINENFSPQAK